MHAHTCALMHQQLHARTHARTHALARTHARTRTRTQRTRTRTCTRVSDRADEFSTFAYTRGALHTRTKSRQPHFCTRSKRCGRHRVDGLWGLCTYTCPHMSFFAHVNAQVKLVAADVAWQPHCASVRVCARACARLRTRFQSPRMVFWPKLHSCPCKVFANFDSALCQHST